MAKARKRIEITPVQALVLFSFGTAACVVISVGGFVLGKLIWTDMLHHNPNRSVSSMLVMLPFATLFIGLWQVVNFAGALMTSGGVAALAARRFGYVPLLVVSALLPASFLLIYLQDSLTPTASFFMDPPEAPTQWDRVSRNWLYAMVPVLLMSWLAQRMFFRSNDHRLR